MRKARVISARYRCDLVSYLGRREMKLGPVKPFTVANIKKLARQGCVITIKTK